MNLNEAKQNARDLNATLATLVAATEGVKESDFAAQQARKDALEAAIADTQKKLIAESNAAIDKLAKAKFDTDAKLAELDNQIKTAQTLLKATQNDANVSRDAMRESIASERAALLKEKQEILSRLDVQIAAKVKSLADIDAAIEAGRARFA
jgi:archaellum component FlaC